MSGRIFVQIQAATYLKWTISLSTIFMTQFWKGTMIDLVHSVVGKKRLKTKVSRSCATLNLFCPHFKRINKTFPPYQRCTQNIQSYWSQNRKQGLLRCGYALMCESRGIRALEHWSIRALDGALQCLGALNTSEVLLSCFQLHPQ